MAIEVTVRLNGEDVADLLRQLVSIESVAMASMMPGQKSGETVEWNTCDRETCDRETCDREPDAPGMPDEERPEKPAEPEEEKQQELAPETAEPETPDEEKKLKKEDVRAVLIDAKKAGINIVELLQPYGDSLGAVDKADYPKLMADAQKALEQKEGN